MKKNKKNGFTLVEMMVTLTLISIVLAIGVPNFKNTVRNTQLTAQSNEFVAVMNYARSEAIKRGARVSVCASDPTITGNTAQTLCTGAWNKGWLMFTDPNGNCSIDTGEQSIRIHGGLNVNTTFTAVKSIDSSAITCIGYNLSGNSTTTDSDVNFTMCDPILKLSRSITINMVGHLINVSVPC